MPHESQSSPPTPPPAGADRPVGAEDFDFLIGTWDVRHRKLGRRLVGDDAWWEFDGTCRCWSIVGGLGNIDDNVLDQPTGAYRGASLRLFDTATRLWSIRWMNGGAAAVEPPVRGRFEDGRGEFTGDDVLDGRSIAVRFVWSQITDRSAVWEQAFSADAGARWETNWVMTFRRAG